MPGPHASAGTRAPPSRSGALGPTIGRIACVGKHVLPGAVVGRPEHVGVLVEAERADPVHDMADARVVLDDRVAELALRGRFADVLRRRHVRLMHLHEIDAHEERDWPDARAGRDSRARPSRHIRQRTGCRRRPCPAC